MNIKAKLCTLTTFFSTQTSVLYLILQSIQPHRTFSNLLENNSHLIHIYRAQNNAFYLFKC